MKKVLLFVAIIMAGTVISNAQSWGLSGNSIMGTEVLGTTNNQSLNLISNGSTRLTIKPDGNIGIGTTATSGFLLSVDGKVRAREVFINLDTWADYVFEPSYQLMALPELEKYIAEYKHLPGIPSTATMTNGQHAIGDVQVMLLEKIEELSLYIIQLNNRINALENE